MCVGTVKYKPQRKGSWIRRIGFDDVRGVYYTLDSKIDCVDVLVHGKCSHNEYAAIRNRVQQRTPPIDPYMLTRLRMVARTIQVKGQPDEFWWAAYKGRKLALYQEAWESLIDLPLRRKDSYVRAFVKPEKLFKNGDPRMIQARTPRYNVVVGKYLRPLEHDLYRLRSVGRWLASDLPLIAKGLNQRARAEVIAKKLARFGHCYSLDLSRFDAHISQELLQLEHSVYLRAHRNHPELRKLLGWQLLNKCFCKSYTYNSVGGRMSGDMNTALGNCLLMLIMSVTAAMESGLGPHEYDLFIDGDDTLLFTSSNAVEAWPDLFRRMGQELKLENSSAYIHTVEHCRCRPIQTADGLRMVPNPYKVIKRTTAGVRHWPDRKFWPKMFTLLGTCELAMSAGVPILQEYALALLRWGRGQLPRRWIYLERWAKVNRELRERNPEPLQITTEARISMWEAWDICPAQQAALEDWLRRSQSWDAA